jgi:hypothetical protein
MRLLAVIAQTLGEGLPSSLPSSIHRGSGDTIRNSCQFKFGVPGTRFDVGHETCVLGQFVLLARLLTRVDVAA